MLGEEVSRPKPYGIWKRELMILMSSFAHMEINLILAKMMWKYDMEMLDKGLDWEGESRVHVMWSKPELKMRFYPRKM